MTEKEKMLAGKYYIHKDEELRSMSRKCREAIYEFNFSSWEQSEYRIKILNELFGYPLSIERGNFLMSVF